MIGVVRGREVIISETSICEDFVFPVEADGITLIAP